MIQIGRKHNRHADSLATLASLLTEEVRRLIKVEVVKESSIDVKVNISIVMVFEQCWMDLIIEFLAKDHVPNDEKEVKKYAESLLSIGCLKTVGCTRELLGTLSSVFAS